MSFMVLNTGRVASQYFYINLSLQPNIIMPSRYEFDNVAKSFIKRRYRSPLKNLAQYRENELRKKPTACFGIVFHSARRNLVYPLSSKKNIDFLKALKDELKLDTIFFPIRDPDKVFKSEMNRQLARIVGDWSFPLGLNGWKKKWSLTHCKTLDKHGLIHDDCDDFLPKEINYKNLKESSRNFIISTAKIHSLYKLFDQIFGNVKVFEYEYLFDAPKKIFRSMGEEKGFSFSDFSLTKAKLNSLPNRFMLYNSFTLVIDRQMQKNWQEKGISKKEKIGIKQKTSLKRILFDKQNPFIKSCRFKFEIPKVMRVCEDWGKYEQIDLISKDEMPLTHDAIGSIIGIGIHCDDRPIFTKEEINEMIKTIRLVICPRFDKNFKILLDYYRNNVYHQEIPIGDFYNDFKKNNKQEFLDIEKILKNSNNRLKFS